MSYPPHRHVDLHSTESRGHERCQRDRCEPNHAAPGDQSGGKPGEITIQRFEQVMHGGTSGAHLVGGTSEGEYEIQAAFSAPPIPGVLESRLQGARFGARRWLHGPRRTGRSLARTNSRGEHLI